MNKLTLKYNEKNKYTKNDFFLIIIIIELNEQVIQELLYIPMNLAVTKSTCDKLTLKVIF